MKIQRIGTWAAIVGSICWAFGATSAVLDELDYRGLTDSPIPFAVGTAVTAIGSALLILAFVTIRRIHVHQGATAGAPGYWMAITGLVLMLFPVWPLIFLGPLVVALGMTIYAGATLSSGKTRSFGLWLHALNIPFGVVVGFAFDGAGYDGGIGIMTSLVMVITGIMTMAYDAAAYSEQPVASLAAEGVVTA